MDNLQPRVFSALQPIATSESSNLSTHLICRPIATSESSNLSTQPCDKTGEENLRDIVGMLVRQMNRMENSIAFIEQSQTNKQTGTPNFGEVNTIKCDNISLHVPTDGIM